VRAIALIGARAGSERVPGKNIRRLAGHPLLAYAIATAQQAGVFERVLVSTDSEQIADVARWYGADVPFLRPSEYATSTSPDIEWIRYVLGKLPETYDVFAIVRATNPFRGPDVILRGLDQLVATPEADSVRAVELVKQHPGKMWELAADARTMTPLLDQSGPMTQNSFPAGSRSTRVVQSPASVWDCTEAPASCISSTRGCACSTKRSR
jgi:CMP-N-acetylneuraminic acid synthetase